MFKTIGGFKVYDPFVAKKESNKKNPCPDCAFCQLCSESRCNVCKNNRKNIKKLSLGEQIELYNRINRLDC